MAKERTTSAKGRFSEICGSPGGICDSGDKGDDGCGCIMMGRVFLVSGKERSVYPAESTMIRAVAMNDCAFCK